MRILYTTIFLLSLLTNSIHALTIAPLSITVGISISPSVSSIVAPPGVFHPFQGDLRMGGGHWGWGPAYQLRISDGINTSYTSDALKQPEGVVSDDTFFYVSEQSGDQIRKIDYQGNTVDYFYVQEPRYLAIHGDYLYATWDTFADYLHVMKIDGSWTGRIYGHQIGLTGGGFKYSDYISSDDDYVYITSNPDRPSGDFRLDATHTYTYDPADLIAVATSVPEPSSYALLLGGLALGLVALRRR